MGAEPLKADGVLEAEPRRTSCPGGHPNRPPRGGVVRWALLRRVATDSGERPAGRARTWVSRIIWRPTSRSFCKII